MAAMVECKCKTCRNPFMARVADRRRGWGMFCSKSCKAVKQERRTGQCADYFRRQRDRSGFDHDFDDVDISDMDFGASDGGGYEPIK